MATRNSEAGGTKGGSGGTEAGQKATGGGSAGTRSGASGPGSKAAGGQAGAKSGGARTGAKKGTGTRAGAKKTADTSTGAKKTADTSTGPKKATGARGGTKKAAGSRAGGKAGTAAKKSGSSAAKTTGGSAASSQKLRSDLRGFVQAHPGGWGHNEWIGLVNLLKERGHDTSDTDAIGMALERERLTLVLERVPGLGAQRVKAIADKYPRIWNVMQAGAEELATAANLPKALAKKVKDALP